jgi:RimJ/RimL family protein N-acetyltransferase
MSSAAPVEALEHVVTLRNGADLRLRPIRPDDAPGLIALCGRLSPRTIYQRFFTVRRLRPEDATALCTVDGRERMAIVAERDIGQRTELVGVARYGLAGEDQAPDVGLVVEDAWQGLGLGSILLSEIMREGERQGFSTFHAEVLAENARMRRLLARSAEILERRMDHGVITVLFRRPADSRGSSKSAGSWPAELSVLYSAETRQSKPGD